MPNTYEYKSTGGRGKAVSELLVKILELDRIDAVLVPAWLPMKDTVMPVLVSAPESLADADPLAPAFPLNAARLVSRLTRKSSGRTFAAVMRPCEIRAFVELVKLNQADPTEVVLIGADCFGAYTNQDFQKAARAEGRGLTAKFLKSGPEGPVKGLPLLAPACRVCEKPVPDGADVAIRLFGEDDEHLEVCGQSTRGVELLKRLGLNQVQPTVERDKTVESLVLERSKQRDEMFAATKEATDNLEKLTAYLAGCVNCYNCRVACPVCYCRECVFTTDVFEHQPDQYLKWSLQKGLVKMPTDTVFYHLTRLAHMSTACVGCGQCSNACPNDIPIMELFRTIAAATQASFDYEAGRSLDEAPPLSIFNEDEYREVTGL